MKHDFIADAEVVEPTPEEAEGKEHESEGEGY